MNSVPACWKPGNVFALVGERDEERLEGLARPALRGQQVIGMPPSRAATDHFEATTRGHVLGALRLLAQILQQRGRANAQTQR